MVLMKSSVTSPSKIGTAKNENNPLEKLKWGNINDKYVLDLFLQSKIMSGGLLKKILYKNIQC